MMNARRAVLVLAAMLVFVCLAAAAVNAASRASSSRLRLVAASTAAVATDGGRYLVYVSAHGDALQVLDTATGTTKSIPVPAGCALPASPSLQAAAAGHVLLQCSPGPSPTSAIVDLTTGSSQVPPSDLSSAGATGVTSYTQIGTQWLWGDTSCGNAECWSYYNWHTGEQRVLSGSRPADLDSAEFQRLTLCAPYERLASTAPGMGIDIPDFRWHAGRRLLFVRRSKSTSQLILAHCGGTERRLQRAADLGITGIHLSNGRATWSGGPRGEFGCAYSVATGRSYRWRYPRINSTAEPRDGFVLTAGPSVFVAVALTADLIASPTSYRLYATGAHPRQLAC